MGVRNPTAISVTVANAALAQAAETIAVVSPAFMESLDFEQLLIFWYVGFTTGTTATAVQAKLRRGPLVTSPQINITSNAVVTASAGGLHAGAYLDTPGAAAGLQYSLTLTQVGAGTAGTINDVCIAVVGL